MISCRLKLAIGVLLTGGAVAYSPFAEVEEFNPRPLGQFCDPEVKTGIRHCEGKTHKVLEDGGIVSLNWAMHADPDRILSLDTEQQHGVRLVKCTPSSLELILPASHARHAQVGELIIASHFVHGCEHLMQRKENEEDQPINYNLYHRVTKVSSLQWRNADGSMAAGSADGKVAHAKLWTRELPTLGHAVGSITYDFDYTPLEAKDPSAYPERRTWDSDYYRGQWIEPSAEVLAARRLTNHPSEYEQRVRQPEYLDAEKFSRPSDSYHPGFGRNSDVKFKVDGGHPMFGGTTETSNDVKTLMNLQPKKVANFGWNWNFKINASQDISFKYTVPGNQMYVVIGKPYVKAHSKLRFKFRSYMPNENAEDTFFTDNTWVSLKKHSSDTRADIFEQWVPRVKWEASMKGHGKVEASLKAQMNAHMSISSNPLEMIQIPVLQQFWKPKWFGTVDFNLGNLPVSLTPGIQFKAKFFHYGTFRGSLSVGLKAHPDYHPKLQFDSFTGLRVDMHTQLKEVTITPPNWMVSTSHFECGIALEPTIWIKGHLGKVTQDTKFAAALRPYFNMTITRGGDVQATLPGDTQKELVVYPFRVVGLKVDSTKRYKVRIETHMSAPYCIDDDSYNERESMEDYQGSSQQSGDTSGHWNSADQNWGNNELSQDYGSNDDVDQGDGNRLRPNGKKLRCEHFLRRMDSTEGLNWGELEFQDAVDRFSFGFISQQYLMHLKVRTRLVEVDYSSGAPFERLSKQMDVQCRTIINGVCQPSPMMHEIWWADGTHVKVYLHMLWKDNPRDWFNDRIRGVAASFPEVIINKDYVSQMVPGFSISTYANTGTVTGENANKPLVLVLRHAFKSFPILIDQHNGFVPGMNSSSLKSSQIIELGASFLSTWDRTCVTGTQLCDPKLLLYHGDVELATAEIPRIPWNTREGMSDTQQTLLGNEAASSRVVPVSVALKPVYHGGEYSNWNHVGLVRMKFEIANPAAWNRFISPFEYTGVTVGSTFKLIWSLNNAAEDKATNFQLNIRKGGTKVDATSIAGEGEKEHLTPRIGDQWFTSLSNQEISVMPSIDSTGGSKHYRFIHDIDFAGAGVGDTILASVSWADSSGNKHTMYTPPFLVEVSAEVAQAAANAAAQSAAAEAAAAQATAETGTVAPLVQTVVTTPAPARKLLTGRSDRRLDFDIKKVGDTIGQDFDKLLSGGDPDAGWKRSTDGRWTHSRHGTHIADDPDNMCQQKDLNFAFGSGIMARAYVEHLSLPADIPVLGAIQSAPRLGTPWVTLTGWMSSPTDLASKLPSLLCRHGVCSATLPGCPAYSDLKHYYPEITLQFRHTLKYPAETGAKKDQWVAALKTALSYTFAVMPEAISMVMHYANLTVPQGEFNPETGIMGVDQQPAHRRRYQQYHNVLMGQDACENHDFDAAQCQEVGCCTWDDACHSAVGNGPCYAGVAAPTGPEAAIPTGPTVAPVTPLEPMPAITPNTPLPGTAAPVVAPAAVATGTTAAPAGPVIQPLNRRLQGRFLAEAETEPHVHAVSIQFNKGLKYDVDNLLMDQMLKEGLFKEVEEVPSGDKPLRIHSYAIRNLGDLSQKDSLPKDLRSVFQSPQQTLVLSAFAGCALMGVAFLVRRARGSYQRVSEESSGPVE